MVDEKQQVQLNVNLNDCEDFTCKVCGWVYFQIVNRVKILSALQSPTGKEHNHGIVVLKCDRCGEMQQ